VNKVLRLTHHVEPDAWQVVNSRAVLTRREDATSTVTIVQLLTVEKRRDWYDSGIRTLLHLIHTSHVLNVSDRINIRAAVHALVRQQLFVYCLDSLRRGHTQQGFSVHGGPIGDIMG
jgi:hypothetical protein